MGREAELIAAIAGARAPGDDAGPRLVLADHLQSCGDPRGELMAIAASANAPEREAELVAAIERRLAAEGGLPARSIARWDRGFVDTLDLTVTEEPFAWPTDGALGLVRELWLTIGDDTEDILDALARTCPGTLRRLHVATRDLAALHVTLQRAVAAFPNLVELSLGPWTAPVWGESAPAGGPTLVEVLAALPRDQFTGLDVSAYVGGSADDPDLLALLRAWPLERLVLARNRPRQLAAARGELAPLLDGEAWPRLRHLGLLVRFTGELLDALPGTPVFARLDALTVNRNGMTAAELAIAKRRRADYARIRFVAPSGTPELALAAADLLRMELARPAEAVPIYEAALRAAPDNQHVRYGLAAAHHDLADYARALGEIDRGVAAAAPRPAWEWLTWQRSKPLQMMGRHGEARAALEAAVAADPRRASWWSQLAVAHAWFGRWDAALAAWQKARELTAAPTPDWLQRYLAQTFVHLGDGAQALAIVEPAVAATPDNWHFAFLRGLALIDADAARAVDAFRALAERTKPDDHFVMDRARLGAALAFAALGATDDAVGELDAIAATTWCPAIVAPAWLLAGCVLRAAGRDTDAEARWRRCAADPAAVAELANAGGDRVHASCDVPGAWSRDPLHARGDARVVAARRRRGRAHPRRRARRRRRADRSREDVRRLAHAAMARLDRDARRAPLPRDR